MNNSWWLGAARCQARHKTAWAVGLSALMLIGLSACDRLAAWGGGGFYSMEVSGADYAKSLVLSDAAGKARSLTEFRGKVVLVFFGFTQCPDVCPTSLGEMAMLRKKLGPDGQRVQVLFITVDPERDTPEVLAAYMQAFDPTNSGAFVALRPSPEQLKQVAQAFKIYYAKVPGKTPTSYTMDHTAGSYVFDPKGQVRLFTRYGGDPDKLLHDVQQLLAEPAS